MNVLIVYAHPESHSSFNGAMKDLAVTTLTEQGHEVTVSDLYAMNWNAVTGEADFTGERSDPENCPSRASRPSHAKTGHLPMTSRLRSKNWRLLIW